MRPFVELAALSAPTPHTEAVPGTAASWVKIHGCRRKFGVARDQVAPDRCHRRDGWPLTFVASATPQLPPCPSAAISTSSHVPPEGPPSRTIVQAGAAGVHFAAKAVVPLAPFFTEPPIQTVPPGSVSTLVKFAPAGSAG